MFTVHYQDSFFSFSFLQEPKEVLETTDKIANKLVQQIQLLKRRSKKCGENTRPRQRDGVPERSEGQRLVCFKNIQFIIDRITILLVVQQQQQQQQQQQHHYHFK